MRTTLMGTPIFSSSGRCLAGHRRGRVHRGVDGGLPCVVETLDSAVCGGDCFVGFVFCAPHRFAAQWFFEVGASRAADLPAQRGGKTRRHRGAGVVVHPVREPQQPVSARLHFPDDAHRRVDAAHRARGGPGYHAPDRRDDGGDHVRRGQQPALHGRHRRGGRGRHPCIWRPT